MLPASDVSIEALPGGITMDVHQSSTPSPTTTSSAGRKQTPGPTSASPLGQDAVSVQTEIGRPECSRVATRTRSNNHQPGLVIRRTARR